MRLCSFGHHNDSDSWQLVPKWQSGCPTRGLMTNRINSTVNRIQSVTRSLARGVSSSPLIRRCTIWTFETIESLMRPGLILLQLARLQIEGCASDSWESIYKYAYISVESTLSERGQKFDTMRFEWLVPIEFPLSSSGAAAGGVQSCSPLAMPVLYVYLSPTHI